MALLLIPLPTLSLYLSSTLREKKFPILNYFTSNFEIDFAGLWCDARWIEVMVLDKGDFGKVV